MLTFQVAFRYAGGAVMDLEAPGSQGARMTVAANRSSPPVLTATLDPQALSLTAATANPATLHYFRLADGTVKPLPPTPPALTFHAGDAYLGVTPGAARMAAGEPGGPSAAIARFIHLRDYFNADKLAMAVLEHLLELGGGARAEGAGVVVVEAR